jgi:hypothetical protein
MKIIRVPILNISIVVYQSENIPEFLKKYGIERDEYTLACTFFNNNDDSFLNVVFCINPEKKTIAHEAVHLTNMIFQKRGIKPDLDNDELQAYLTAFLFEKIDKIVSKRRGNDQ